MKEVNDRVLPVMNMGIGSSIVIFCKSHDGCYGHVVVSIMILQEMAMKGYPVSQTWSQKTESILLMGDAGRRLPHYSAQFGKPPTIQEFI